VEENILQEAEEYKKIQSLYHRLYDLLCRKEEEPTVRRAQRLLLTALRERLLEKMERIFRLLGLEYGPDDMFNAYRASTSSKAELRANAIEFMDNVLQPHLKRNILPILDSGLEELPFTVPKEFSTSALSETESIHSIMESNDKWLVVCALYLMAESKNRELASYAEKFKDYPDPTVQETLSYALEKLQPISS
jgi:AAA family ATP:ADP antiporter